MTMQRHLLSLLLNSMQMWWKSSFEAEDQVLLAVVLFVLKWIGKFLNVNETLRSSGWVDYSYVIPCFMRLQ